MNFLLLLLILCVSVAGIFGYAYAFLSSRKIYLGVDEKTYKPITNSCLTGVSVTLISISMLLAVGEFSPNLRWPSNWSLIAILLSLLCGIAMMLSTLWSFYLAGALRNIICKLIKTK